MANKKDVQKQYDAISDTYTKKLSQNTPPQKQKELVSKFKTLVQGNILDVGCGPKPFEMAESETIGLDFSRGQLNKITADMSVVQGEMSQLPFKDKSFSGLVAFYSLIHLPFEDHTTAWSEFYRVLKNGGVGLVTEGDSRWEGSQEDWINSGEKMKWDLAGKENTQKHLQQAGFEILEIADIRDPTADDGSTKPFYLVKK
jgi:ubiquinone/menaquinone biosynthesis C-methylase UbiE